MPRTTATRILLLALAGGVLTDIAVPGNAPGLNAPLLVAVLLGAALAVAGPAGIRRMDPADAWLAPASLVLAAFAAVRADPWLVSADLAFAAAAAAGAIAAFGGARITRALVPAVVAVALTVVGAAAIGALDAVAAARPGPRDGPPRRRLLSPAQAGVLRGLAIAFPLVVLFGLLFAAADAVFERVAGTLLDWRIDVDVADATGRVGVIGIVAWVAAGLLALGAACLPALTGRSWVVASPNDVPAPPARSLGAASASAGTLQGSRGAATTEATTVLAVLDGLFAGFVVLQVAYLFGGADTRAAAGVTYADYARRGFFELVAVAVLAMLLVVAFDVAVGRRSRAQLAAGLVLLALTGVVLASALLRLRLYQDAYGWTELRFVVLSAIAWLAVALVAVGALLAMRRARWVLHALGILTLVTISAMNVVGPQSTVAGQNLARALDPSLVPPGGRTGLDGGYLATLGDEAVPGIVAAWNRLDAGDRAALERFLQRRDRALTSDGSLTGWPSWNLAREQARDALAAWRARASASRAPMP